MSTPTRSIGLDAIGALDKAAGVLDAVASLRTSWATQADLKHLAAVDRDVAYDLEAPGEDPGPGRT